MVAGHSTQSLPSFAEYLVVGCLNAMKLSVSYKSSTSIVHSYEVLACVLDTVDVPNYFMIVMTVKSKQGCYTLSVCITRSIEVALAVSIQSLPEFTHCIKWRMHEVDIVYV